MKAKQLSNFPIKTEHNRVERLYTGGKLLDRWQHNQSETDCTFSEDLLITTVEYLGPGNPALKGLSQIKLESGKLTDLSGMILSDREAFLGSRFSNSTDHPKVLVRVGDSNVRLVIQCHPNNEMARKYFNISSGKTEAWYIVDTREIDGIKPHLYCGFKPGVTRVNFAKLVEEQNIIGMLESMHRIEVQVGDLFMIKAGMPHAMGSGCLFVEVHEPCDYTIRVKRQYATKTLTDDEMHYGLGFEALFDFFDYSTYSKEEIEKKVIGHKVLEEKKDNNSLYNCFDYDQSTYFNIKVLDVNGTYLMPKFPGHYILITIKNDIYIESDNNNMLIEQGNGVFVPANTEIFSIIGDAEVLIAYPALLDMEGVKI